jgi:cyclopropane-fatty-acyl-phospholipid synthase
MSTTRTLAPSTGLTSFASVLGSIVPAALFEPILARMEATYAGPPLRVRLWDGTERRFGAGAPTLSLGFETPTALFRSLLQGNLGFGESYASGDVTVDGDLEDLLAALMPLYLAMPPEGPLEGWLKRTVARSLPRERADIEHHYGIGDDFYRFYLDDELQYSCAYFRTPADTLEQAQEHKIRHTVAKLRLERGQRLLDIGCGWGHLMLHAAERYGVACTGITLCENQATYIREQARARRLPVSVRVMSYLELDPAVKWERVVSVGMMCHIGESRIDTFYDRIRSLLAPDAICLLHAIVKMREQSGADPFVSKHVFPGYWFNSVEGMTRRAVERDLQILDVENLRRHYHLTAQHWRRRFRHSWTAIQARFGFDERFMRTWDYYLASVAAGFRTGRMSLIQMVMSNGVNHAYPLTRDFLYEPAVPANDLVARRAAAQVQP